MRYKQWLARHQRTKELTVLFTDVTFFTTTNVGVMWRILVTILSTRTTNFVNWKCMVSMLQQDAKCARFFNITKPDIKPIFFLIDCSNPGHFGPNCSIPCPINCQERRCDVNTGQCLGCLPGYQGLNCAEGNLFYYMWSRCIWLSLDDERMNKVRKSLHLYLKKKKINKRLMGHIAHLTRSP